MSVLFWRRMRRSSCLEGGHMVNNQEAWSSVGSGACGGTGDGGFVGGGDGAGCLELKILHCC